MAISKAERLAAVHQNALSGFDKVQAALRDERLQCLQDRRFYSIAGAQWEGPIGQEFENKVRFEFNKSHLAVIRIFNEYRNNRISVDFTPRDGASNPDLADTCNGLYRADEQDSGAQEAYDNAFEEAVGGGFGAWRVSAAYEDDEDDDDAKQCIRIEPIFDADTSVYFDLNAKRQDKADATECWVLSSMTHEAFEDEYGHKPSTWPKSVYQRQFDWYTPDVVYVAEYYKVENIKETVHVYRGLDGTEESYRNADFRDDDKLEETLKASGWREIRQKKVTRKRVHKYILSGNGVEDDCGYIAGKNIPIIPMYGKRWFVDNVERCMGHVRLAKDAQRLMNSLLSWLTEMAARFDIEKPIMSPEQLLGHASMWANDNVERYPYLLANLLRDQNGELIPGSNAPVAYTRAPNVPPAMAALIQIAGQALDDLLGNPQAGEQIQPNISGKAIELIQNRLDMQAYIYMSNMAKAVKRSGEVWLSMKKETVYEEGRRMKTISSDGTVGSVVMRRPIIDEKSGAMVFENDLDDANFDVYTDVGPSSISQRSATVRALSMMQQNTADPTDQKILSSTIMMNMEGEGLRDVNAYYRKQLVQMGVVQPTAEEKAELEAAQAQQQPDPQSAALLAMAEESQANAALGRAKTVDTIAGADLKRAQTAKTWADAMGQEHQKMLASAETLQKLLAQPAPGQLQLRPEI